MKLGLLLFAAIIWTRASAQIPIVDRTQPYWMSIGPKPSIPNVSTWGHTSGRINTIAVKPDDANVVLVGASNGGIWRSSDAGATFSPVADDQVDLIVGSIAFAPANPSIVYAGMGDGFYLGTGVLRSTDGGQSWTRVSNESLPPHITTRRIIVDSADPNRINLAMQGYQTDQAGGFSAGGQYLSTDGGVNWTRTLPGVGRDVATDPINPRTVYGAMASAVTAGTVAPGVYK